MKHNNYNLLGVVTLIAIVLLSFTNVSAQSTIKQVTPVGGNDPYIIGAGKTVSQQQAEDQNIGRMQSLSNSSQTIQTEIVSDNALTNQNSSLSNSQVEKTDNYQYQASGNELEFLTDVTPHNNNVVPLGSDPNAIRQFINHEKGTPVSLDEIDLFKTNLLNWLKQDNNNIAKMTAFQYSFIIANDYTNLYKQFALINRSVK